jgi:2-dehydro-3-deoxyphosphooctonate aldolase (KDO 8-P synthase)
MTKTIRIGNVDVGGNHPFVLIAGPCVIESPQLVYSTAAAIKKITQKHRIPFIFKASYDKANRTSIDSFRGPGIEAGLQILSDIKQKLGIPVLSDIHDIHEIKAASSVLDVLQIPAFLCRQTDLLVAAAKSGRCVNVKKGQFLAPWDMGQVVKKLEHAGCRKILLTERGTTFGYNNLVTDFRSLPTMQSFGYPVVMDASHSVQQPGGLGKASGGKSEFIPLLARCAVAAGCDAVFMEVHPNPSKALSDGPNMVALKNLEKLLVSLKAIDHIVQKSLR